MKNLGALQREILDIFEVAFASGVRDEIVKALSGELETLEDAACSGFLADLQQCGVNWGYQKSQPLVTRWMVCLLRALFHERGRLTGMENCQQATRDALERPVVMLGNHLSYGDVNYLKALLEMSGYSNLPLLVLAGPKVYQDLFRRMMSMAFETLKVAQPSGRASEGAEVGAKELATVTRNNLSEARRMQGLGRILYFFPEGTRSRSGGMNRFVAASGRYLESDRTLVYPVGYNGTEGLLGVGDSGIHAQDIEIRVGQGICFEHLCVGLEACRQNERRKRVMDRLGFAVASLLDEKYRGVYSFKEKREGEETLAEDRDWFLTTYGRV